MNWTLLIEFAMVALVGVLIGFILGRDIKRPFNIADIDGHIQERFPDVWTAYHEGVNEGYQQGLRDGGPDE